MVAKITRSRSASGEIDCSVNRPCPEDCTVCQILLYHVWRRSIGFKFKIEVVYDVQYAVSLCY